MRAKAVGAGLLVFAVGGLVGWAIALVVDDSASSDEVAAITDDLGALEATVAALEDEVAETSGEVAALEDDVATSAGRLTALDSDVRALLLQRHDAPPPTDPVGLPVLSLTCGSEPATRIVEGFLVDADPDQVPVLSVLDADGAFEAVEIGDEVPVGADYHWNLRDETSPVRVQDITDRCGDEVPADPPPASVTVGCGAEPGSLVIEAFDPDIDPAQTALLYSREVGGRLDQLEVGDVVPPDGELQWSILGIARGPWPVDEVVDTCTG